MDRLQPEQRESARPSSPSSGADCRKVFHGGGEYRLGRINLRDGAVYSRELWNPAGGLGVNFSPETLIDVAVYSKSVNVERERRGAIAVPLRIGL